MHIGQAIRIFRLQRNLTQEQLALEANIATSNISRIESGQRQPSQGLLIRLAKSLKTTPATLYSACEETNSDTLELQNTVNQYQVQLTNDTQRQLLTADAQTLLKLFHELTPENKMLLLEQIKLLRKWQNSGAVS